MLTKREKILFVTLVVTVIASATIILSLMIRIPSVGRIKAIGVKFYWDGNATQEATEIDWGMLSPSGTYGVTLFCKNIRNVPVTLNLTTNNWNPPDAQTYLHGDWNYTAGTIIQPQEIIPIQFQLTVDINIINIDAEQKSQ